MMLVTITRSSGMKMIKAQQIDLSTSVGRRTILPGHEPMLFLLSSSQPLLIIDEEGNRHEESDVRGIVMVERNQITIIVE